MQIKQITFTNSKGDSITINKTGTYRLTGTFVTSGLDSTVYTTNSYMQHGRTYFNSTYKEDDMSLTFMIMKAEPLSVATFVGKITGSVTDNPNKFSWANVPGLQAPSYSGWIEGIQTRLDKVKLLDGSVEGNPTSVLNAQAQHLFSFDVIQYLERKYTSSIWNGKTDITSKVITAKRIISALKFVWNGYGSNGGGNKGTMAIWARGGNTWSGSGSTTNGSVTRIARDFVNPSDIAWFMTDDGYYHMLAYAESSDGSTASIINTDYAELQITVNPSVIERNARQQLSKVFSPHLGEGSLAVTLEDNTYYVRDCSVDVAPFFPTGFNENNNKWQNVIVELVANNPFWAGQSVSVPFNNNIGGTGTGFVTVTNEGQASTGFVMDFTATGTGTFHIVKDVPGPINPEIQIFGINNNDIIHIDTRYGGKTVQVNGVTRWDLVAPNSNFFELDQGDNVILCEQVHNTGTITFNPKYIGF